MVHSLGRIEDVGSLLRMELSPIEGVVGVCTSRLHGSYELPPIRHV